MIGIADHVDQSLCSKAIPLADTISMVSQKLHGKISWCPIFGSTLPGTWSCRIPGDFLTRWLIAMESQQQLRSHEQMIVIEVARRLLWITNHMTGVNDISMMVSMLVVV